MFGGLREWVSAGWVELEDVHPTPGKEKATDTVSKKWVRRRRDLVDAFMVMVASHLVGFTLFAIICQGWFDIRQMVCCRSWSLHGCCLIFISEHRNSGCLLDNSRTRPMEIPLP
jgi:hypothetical protein